jgi:osmotically-inducible protein OsmY
MEDETMVRRLLVAAILCGLNVWGLASADTAANSQNLDADLRDRVVRQLSESDRDVVQRVHVSTQNGVVMLEATGLTSVQVSKILVVVRAVPGVTKVENRLHVGM